MESRTISSSAAKTQSLPGLILLTTSIVFNEQATASDIEVTVENLSAKMVSSLCTRVSPQTTFKSLASLLQKYQNLALSRYWDFHSASGDL